MPLISPYPGPHARLIATQDTRQPHGPQGTRHSGYDLVRLSTRQRVSQPPNLPGPLVG